MARNIKRLRRLAAYRSRLERQQEMRLATARRDTLQREESLQDAQGRLDSMLTLGVANRGEIDPVELSAGSGYLVRVGREVTSRSSALNHYRERESAELEEVLERRRERRAMESLLDQELAREAIEARRDEATKLDEQAAKSWWQQQR